MNKIYLKLKKDISVYVKDGNWALYTGDMLVLKRIGIRTTLAFPNMEIHNDSYLLLGFEYETYKDITKTLIDGDTERHKVWNECNSVDTLIKISTGEPLYKNKTLTYSEIVEIVKTNNAIIDNYTFEDIFENVSITYNRDYKLKELGI